MKKFLLSISIMLTAFCTIAQAKSTLIFCDKDGNALPDEITANTVEKDIFGDLQIKPDVYVKNNTSKDVNYTASIKIASISGGTVQCCFPDACRMLTETGTTDLGGATLAANGKVSINTELMIEDAEASAGCVAEITVVNGSETQTLKINFVYDNSILSFSDKDGNAIPNEITVNTVEKDIFGDLQIKPDVYVKNNTSEDVNYTASIKIASLSGGMVQCCFPDACRMLTETGTTDLGSATLAANGKVSINTELMIKDAEASAGCVAEITVVSGNETRTLKINFVYDPAGIDDIYSNTAKAKANVYNLAGQKVDATFKGIVVSNGKKYLNK